MRATPFVAAALLCALLPAGASGAAGAKTKPPRLNLEVRSSPRADLVSDGDAVIRVRVPSGVDTRHIRVRAGRRNVTKFFAVRGDGSFEGIVPGLKVGRTTLTATAPRARVKRRRVVGAKLTVTNHPNGGPLFSGPQIQPWKCGGRPLDDQCNQPATYRFLYRSTDPTKAGLLPYDPEHPPSDVATTTTDQGVEAPFVVRLETGYQDRDQYKILTLFDPAEPWTRYAPQKTWNRKVVIPHGGNCGGDYGSGEAPLDDLSGTIPSLPLVTPSYIAALGRGFAVMSTALDNTGHNCNVAIGAESLIMAKERLTERYGDIRYTIGTGCSGGSIAQQTIANAYPGAVYDGLVITCAYPDTMTAGVQFADTHLLRRYFENGEALMQGFTPVHWGLVAGRPDPVNSIVADIGLFMPALEPVGNCVPAEQAYRPDTNPGGVRCGILDFMLTLFGPRPREVWTPMEIRAGRGFAGIPFGNVGVQYGLRLLERGLITPAQFVDLNARIGGIDVDLERTPERIPGDDTAVANAYRTGMINEMDNMSGVAILHHAGPDPGAAHDYAHSWWIRDRLERAQGHRANHVFWFGPTPLIGDVNWPVQGMLAVDRWLAAVERDASSKSRAQKIVDDKPKDLVDRCELDLCAQEAATRFGTPREVAGGDRFNDISKCRLKPLRREDYRVAFSDEQFRALQAAFPTGVCDWTQKGVGQGPVTSWLKYADEDGKVVYGGTPMGPAPRSRALPARRR